MTKRHRQYPRMTSLANAYPEEISPIRGAILFFLGACAVFFAAFGLFAAWTVLFGVCTCH